MLCMHILNQDNKIIEMAFVYASQRKLCSVSPKDEFPSPAHYTIKQPQPLRNCAPFRTTSLRKAAFDQGVNKELPGPGQYNISKDIIKPKISAYANQSNVIIKVNYTGTPEFKSITKRFDSPSKEVEQVQYDQYAYYVAKKEKKRPARNHIISRTINHSIKKINPSIPTKIRGLLNPEKNQIPGPGDYNINSKDKIVSKGTIWAKDKVQRFNSPTEIYGGGPGAYEISKDINNKRHEETSNFKSGTVRTFFDTIMYNSCSEYIAQHRKKIDFKSPLPAPGQYAVQKPLLKNQVKPQKFQCFGSSSDRFKKQQQNVVDTSRGFYIPVALASNKSFNQLNPSFNSSSQRNTSFISIAQQSNTPGPGEYAHHIEPFRLKKGKQVQKFGSTTERGIQNTKESAEMTPTVNQNQTQLENQLLKSRFGQLETESSIFKSKTNRICFSQTKNMTLNLDYDVTYNDVAKKIQRQRAHLQNLRKIDVYKPPFEINSPRFSHYEQWSKQKIQSTNKKVYPTEKSESQQKKITSIGGKMGRQQRFHLQRKGGGIPGVGNYQLRDQWNKNSHNVMFKRDE